MTEVMQRRRVHFTIITAMIAVLISLLCIIDTGQASASSETDIKYTEGITGGAVYFDKNTGTITGCDDSVTEVILPAAIEDIEVTAIGRDAFNGCSQLKSVVISQNISEITAPVFRGCDSLETIEVETGNKCFMAEDNVLFSSDKSTLYRFPPAMAWTGYTVSDTVTYIAPYAFENAVTLINIQLGKGNVSSMTVGEGCFYGCFNLEKVGLAYDSYGDDVGEYCFEEYALMGSGIKTFKAHLGISEIPAGMFQNCDRLTSVGIGKNVKNIEVNAFDKCQCLQSIYVSSSNEQYGNYGSILTDFDLTQLLKYPYDCTFNQDTFIVPYTVTHIGSEAFKERNKLNTLIVHDDVESFGENVFGDSYEDMTIIANEGTAAEAYAKAHGINFIPAKTTIFPDKLEQRLTVSKTEIDLYVSSSRQSLIARAQTPITYKSSDKSIASVSADGYVIPKSAGTAVITLTAKETSGYKKATTQVTVNVLKNKQYISCPNSSYYIQYGSKPVQLQATASTSRTYESSNPDIAEVSSGGLVTIKSAGKAEITIRANETDKYQSAEKKVTFNISKAQQQLKCDYEIIKQVYTGVDMYYILWPEAKTSVTVKSGNEHIARIENEGKQDVYANIVNPGKTQITVKAEADDKYYSATKIITVDTYLKTPAVKLKKYSHRRIKIRWNKVPGAQKYQVYVYDKSKKKYVCRATRSAAVKSVTHSRLKPGRTYKYKVRAYRVVDGKRVYSSFSAAKTAVAKK